MSEVKYLDIKEFRRLGFLQEINRLLLHPCGLALEVVVEEDGSERLSGVWDYREDPAGIYYGPGMISQEKINNVEQLAQSKVEGRTLRLGYVVQEG